MNGNERGPLLETSKYEYVERRELYALQAKADAYDRMIENNAAIAALLQEMRETLIKEMRQMFQEAASFEEKMKLYKEVRTLSQNAEQALTG